MANDYTPAFLVLATDVGLQMRNSKAFVDDAHSLRQTHPGSCSPSYHLLTTQAFELYAKTERALEVCHKYKKLDETTITQEKIRDEISAEMRKGSHNLKVIYESNPDLMAELEIEKVEESLDPQKVTYVWSYYFYMKSGRTLAIKDLEGIRYAAFARNYDVATWCVNDEEIDELLTRLHNRVSKKVTEAIDELKKYF